MHIAKDVTIPNGAVCVQHRIQMVVAEANQTIATINSYTQYSLDQAAQSGASPLIGWQDRHLIPDAAFTAGLAPFQAVAAYLTSADQPLAGGAIVEDPAPDPNTVPVPLAG